MDRQGRPRAVGKDFISRARKISSSSSDYLIASKRDRAGAHETEHERLTRLDYAENPLFSRYWQTESAVQSWLRNHRGCVQNFSGSAMANRIQFLPPPPPPPPLPPPILFSGALIRKSTKKSKKRRKTGDGTASSQRVTEVTEEWEGVVSISSSEVRAEEPEEEKMDLSEDVLAFMAQTIRHRIEREKKKAQEQEIQDRTVVFVPADRPFMASRFNEFGGDASAVADMLLRRGSDETKLSAAERKRQEMIRLYGDDAAGRIQAEETLMQMKFDQEYDKYHPPFWPNIPLKL